MSLAKNFRSLLVLLVFSSAITSAALQTLPVSGALKVVPDGGNTPKADLHPAATSDLRLEGNAGATAPVPRLVKYSGSLIGAAAGPVQVTFTMYADASTVSPLWIETQTVQVDSQGRFTATLGATSSQGLPADLFQDGAARWLAVTTNSSNSNSNVSRQLLVSVPYALKAEDTEKLNGHFGNEFVLSAELDAAVSAAIANAAGAQQGQSNTANVIHNPTPRKPIGVNGNNTVQGTANGAISFTDTSAVEVVLVQQNGTGSAIQAVSSGASAVLGQGPGINGAAVIYGSASGTGSSVGVQGDSIGNTGIGVYGRATSTLGANFGVRGESASATGTGVVGVNTNTSGSTIGITGQVNSPGGVGVIGESNNAVAGIGAEGIAQAASGASVGVHGEVFSPTGTAGEFVSNNASGNIIVGKGNGGAPQFIVTGQGNVSANGAITAANFVGNGAGLTGVTATLAAGTYSGVYAFTNVSNLFTGVFTGNGSGLTGVVSSGLAAGTYSNAYSFTNAANVFTGNGAALTNLTGANVTGTVANATNAITATNATTATTATNATQLGGIAAASYLLTNGNGSALTNVNATQLAGVAAANYARLDVANNVTSAMTVNSNASTTTQPSLTAIPPAAFQAINTATGAGNFAAAIIGESTSPDGLGVVGIVNSTGTATNAGNGVIGIATCIKCTGVEASSQNTTGVGTGIYASAMSPLAVSLELESGGGGDLIQGYNSTFQQVFRVDAAGNVTAASFNGNFTGTVANATNASTLAGIVATNYARLDIPNILNGTQTINVSSTNAINVMNGASNVFNVDQNGNAAATSVYRVSGNASQSNQFLNFFDNTLTPGVPSLWLQSNNSTDPTAAKMPGRIQIQSGSNNSATCNTAGTCFAPAIQIQGGTGSHSRGSNVFLIAGQTAGDTPATANTAFGPVQARSIAQLVGGYVQSITASPAYNNATFNPPATASGLNNMAYGAYVNAQGALPPGDSSFNVAGGNLQLFGGNGDGNSATSTNSPTGGANVGGNVALFGGIALGTGNGGNINLFAGSEDATTVANGGPGTPGGSGGSVNINAGNSGTSAGVTAGNVNINAGSSTGGTGNGGNIILTPGNKFGTGALGIVQVNGTTNISGSLNVGGTISGTFTGLVANATSASQLNGVPAANFARQDIGNTFAGSNSFTTNNVFTANTAVPAVNVTQFGTGDSADFTGLVKISTTSAGNVLTVTGNGGNLLVLTSGANTTSVASNGNFTTPGTVQGYNFTSTGGGTNTTTYSNNGVFQNFGSSFNLGTAPGAALNLSVGTANASQPGGAVQIFAGSGNGTVPGTQGGSMTIGAGFTYGTNNGAPVNINGGSVSATGGAGIGGSINLNTGAGSNGMNAGDVNVTAHNFNINLLNSGGLYVNGTLFAGGTGSGGSSQWTSTGNNIYYNLGFVGINNTIPSRPLDVNGQVVFSTSTSTDILQVVQASGTPTKPTGALLPPTAVNGVNNDTVNTDYAVGVIGQINAGGGYGVIGISNFTGTGGNSSNGVGGVTLDPIGIGVHGQNMATTGAGFALKGTVNSPSATPLFIQNKAVGATADLIDASNNGTNVFRVDANGNIYTTGMVNAAGCNGCGGGSSQWTTSGPNIYYNAGFVGIGTATPVDVLDIAGANGTSAVRITGSQPFLVLNTTTTFQSGIEFQANGVRKWDIFTDTGGFSQNNLSFVDDVTGVTRLYIDPTGNVGIGTSSPGAMLDVAGNMRAIINTVGVAAPSFATPPPAAILAYDTDVTASVTSAGLIGRSDSGSGIGVIGVSGTSLVNSKGIGLQGVTSTITGIAGQFNNLGANLTVNIGGDGAGPIVNAINVINNTNAMSVFTVDSNGNVNIAGTLTTAFGCTGCGAGGSSGVFNSNVTVTNATSNTALSVTQNGANNGLDINQFGGSNILYAHSTNGSMIVDNNANITLSNPQVATAVNPSVNSPALNMQASYFDGISVEPQTFAWYAQASPTFTPAKLVLAYGEPTPFATYFGIDSNGIVSFAPGQSFPGTGDVFQANNNNFIGNNSFNAPAGISVSIQGNDSNANTPGLSVINYSGIAAHFEGYSNTAPVLDIYSDSGGTSLNIENDSGPAAKFMSEAGNAVTVINTNGPCTVGSSGQDGCDVLTLIAPQNFSSGAGEAIVFQGTGTNHTPARFRSYTITSTDFGSHGFAWDVVNNGVTVPNTMTLDHQGNLTILGTINVAGCNGCGAGGGGGSAFTTPVTVTSGSTVSTLTATDLTLGNVIYDSTGINVKVQTVNGTDITIQAGPSNNTGGILYLKGGTGESAGNVDIAPGQALDGPVGSIVLHGNVDATAATINFSADQTFGSGGSFNPNSDNLFMAGQSISVASGSALTVNNASTQEFNVDAFGNVTVNGNLVLPDVNANTGFTQYLQIGTTGNISTIGVNTNITLAASNGNSTNGSGYGVSISSGNAFGSTSGAAGLVSIKSGDSASGAGSSVGNIAITGGVSHSATPLPGGSISLTGGGSSNGSGGSVVIGAGNGNGGNNSQNGGTLTLASGGGFNSGNINIQVGTINSGAGVGGVINFIGGNSATSAGGFDFFPGLNTVSDVYANLHVHNGGLIVDGPVTFNGGCNGCGVSLSAANTWTGVQTFSTSGTANTQVQEALFTAPNTSSATNVAEFVATADAAHGFDSFSINPPNQGGSGFANGITIRAGGYVGIDNPSPTFKLDVIGTTRLDSGTMIVGNGSASIVANVSTSNAASLYVKNNANTGTLNAAIAAETANPTGTALALFNDNAGGALIAGFNTNSSSATSVNQTFTVLNNGNITTSGSINAAANYYNYAYDTSTQTVSSSGFTDLSFNTPGAASQTWTYAAGTNTFTPNAAGVYLVNFTVVLWQESSGVTTVTFQAVNNSTPIPGANVTVTPDDASGFYTPFSGSFIVPLAATDQLHFQIKDSGGATIAVASPSGSGISVTMIKIQ